MVTILLGNTEICPAVRLAVPVRRALDPAGRSGGGELRFKQARWKVLSQISK